MLARAHPQGLTTPPPVAIAHHIIRNFVEDGCDVLALTRPRRARRAFCAPASSCSTRCFASRNSRSPTARSQAKEFFVVNGGCAANAAVAIARLGGRAALAGPLGGPAGEDDNGDRVLAALAREDVDCTFCQRVDGLATALSAIFMNARGDRTIVTYRDERIATATPADPDGIVAGADAVLADNRYPAFRAADLRSGAAARTCRWCSTATGRRSTTIRCFASPRT